MSNPDKWSQGLPAVTWAKFVETLRRKSSGTASLKRPVDKIALLTVDFDQLSAGSDGGSDAGD